MALPTYECPDLFSKKQFQRFMHAMSVLLCRHHVDKEDLLFRNLLIISMWYLRLDCQLMRMRQDLEHQRKTKRLSPYDSNVVGPKKYWLKLNTKCLRFFWLVLDPLWHCFTLKILMFVKNLSSINQRKAPKSQMIAMGP